MIKDILKLSKQLISIESTSDNSVALKKALKLCLINLNEFTIEKFSSNGVESILVYNADKRPKKFKIIFNGHVDVIPGEKDQYKPKVVGNRLYGIGSMDMKSNLACLIIVFKQMAKKVNYPLGLQIVTDEQTGSINGTKHQVNNGVRASFVIAGETTNFKIVNQAKGVYWLKINTKGKSSHSAYTWKGENAILKMNQFINQVQKKYPTLSWEAWKTTVSVSNINTNNTSFNKIPDECELWLDIRYIPDDEKIIIPSIKQILPKGFSLKIVYQEPPLLINKNNKYLKCLKKALGQCFIKKCHCFGPMVLQMLLVSQRVGVQQ